jgi:hypothetical protein
LRSTRPSSAPPRRKGFASSATSRMTSPCRGPSPPANGRWSTSRATTTTGS